MVRIGLLNNTIQEYSWGSRTAIAELLGNPSPALTPQAELWMGAHPKAPSLFQTDGGWRPLTEVIAENPDAILGKTDAGRFGNHLPYLFKVLAVAQPLSIQAHPDLNQAKRGYEREERSGIPLDAPTRNYKDMNHKPECICALTPFWALNGFRRPKDIFKQMCDFCPHSLETELKEWRQMLNGSGLKRFFTALITLPPPRKDRVIKEVLQSVQKGSGEDSVRSWIQKLHDVYPDDIGILAPLYLNLICLEPGQAMFLPAGRLHSYLEGIGIELMANSDNVLRGGLTHKHVDVKELLNVLDFKEKSPYILLPVIKDRYEVAYESYAKEFVLTVICPPGDSAFVSPRERSVEILICTDGRALLTDTGCGDEIDLYSGISVLVPAAVAQYRIKGKAVVYKAAVSP